MKKRRRRLVFLAVCLLVAAAVMTINDGVQKNRQLAAGNSALPSATPQTSPKTAASPPPPRSGKQQKEPAESSASRRDAVNAAASAFKYINQAQFMPPAQRAVSVNELVAPDLRRKYIKGLGLTGQLLANQWGYGADIGDVLANGYDTIVEQYRVDSFGKGRATVSLYTLSHFVIKSITKDANGNDLVVQTHYKPFGINVVKMLWHNGRWLYNGKADPKPGQTPAFTPQETNLSSDEVAARYKPFLKEGYKPYVAPGD